MAQTTIIRITTAKLGSELGDLRRLASYPASASRQACLAMAALFERIAAGMESATVDLKVGATADVAATGTLTIASGSGAVGGVIGGTTVTATWATSDTVAAAAVAAAINANATTKKLVKATAVAGVVTLTALAPGFVGNQITLTASGTGVTASAAALASGAGDDVASTVFVRT